MAETSSKDAPGGVVPSREAKREQRQAARLARHIRAFAKAHGGSVDGHLAHIGRGRTRIVLVGAEGAWGDLVAATRPVAQRAAELAGLTLHEELGGEVASRISTGPYEWKRMAGIQGPAPTTR